MGYRLSKIYTRAGDAGDTSIDGKTRLRKNHIQIETLGTLDELNSTIGIVLAFEPFSENMQTTLKQIQQDLFDLGGELCSPTFHVITAEKTIALENKIDEWNALLPPLKEFILPGGVPKAAFCHFARTVCRRAERCLVAWHQVSEFNSEILRYINRLSDLLFVCARVISHEMKTAEELWEHERK